ncbi:MAG: hypothetical protein GC165_03380 [Armatimonadetes bacterium]|nr:hypothetical protein [Armatimonadota bacterium]
MKRILGLVVGVFFCGLMLTYGVTQEVPVGKVSGNVTMKENGKPLPNMVIDLVPVASVDDDEVIRTRGVETDDKGNFTLSNVAAGSYYLEGYANVHNFEKRIVTIEEGKTTVSNIIAKPENPRLNLYNSQRVCTPDEEPKFEINGFVPSPDSIQIDIYGIKLDEIAKKGSLRNVLSPLSSNREADIKKLTDASEHIKSVKQKIESPDAEGSFTQRVKLGKQRAGLYFVICRAGGMKAVTFLNITYIALVTKSYQGKMLCFAANLESGQPATDVEVLSNDKGQLDSIGKTDKDGLANVNLPVHTQGDALVIGRKGDSIAVVGFWDGRNNDSPIRISGYCDRPAYRPGDEVQFKGIVRRATKTGYDLPGVGKAQVVVTDPDGAQISKQTLDISSHGTFHGSFSTSKEGKPGGYTIEVSAFGKKSSSMYANVVAYRKPEFSIEVKSDKDFYTMGEQASATVDCKYYFGGPVVGAKVKARIYRSPAWRYEDEDGEQYNYNSGAGEYSQEVEAVTDASGRAKIQFPTRAEDDPVVLTNDYTYSIDASVSEDDAKYFDGSGQVSVVRGDHNLELDVQNPIVAPGEQVDVLVQTTDAIKHDKPAPNRTVTIEIGREAWTENAYVFVPREKRQVTTGADGTAHLLVTATKGESLSFQGTSIDDRGNKIVADASAYVTGNASDYNESDAGLRITLDKRAYKSGDTVRALIETSKAGGTALVCIEGAGILSQRIVPLTSPSTMVEFPVVKDYAPNVYVTGAYIRDQDYFEASKMLKVDREDRDLKIQITSDKQVYKPGDTANVTVQTLNSDGKPAPAEVSVGVVDEGIYDIAQDTTNLKADFYPSRSNQVQTSFSFPEIYLDGGDKGSSNVPLRKTFRDTAQWNPSIWTGPEGKVTVPVVLPDNLTEWRVTAVGVTDATEVGMNTEKFRARKDLMVRLELPQYLVDGDRQRMTAIVTNDTGQDQDVNVELSATGVTLTDGGTKKVHVSNGRPQTIECEIAAAGPGEAAVTAKAWVDGGPNDGVRQSFPIEPHGRKMVAAKSGEGPGSFDLTMKPTVDPKYGSLKISLNPTLAGDLVQSLDNLIGFPYGCVEQTMSRFMPSVLVDKTVRDLGLPRPSNLDDLPKIVRDSLARLNNMRHSDGGFGWWEYDDSDPFMTALVLDGLDRAKRAGQDVSSVNLEPTYDWALKWLKEDTDKDRVRDHFYLAYALMRHGITDAVAALRNEDITKLSPATLANAAMAYRTAGQSARADACLNQLEKVAQGRDVAYWPSEEDAWGSEPTALALVAIIDARPNDPIIPRIVRHLRDTRNGDMWSSTRDTAYSLIGLTAYLAQTKELSGETTATVRVNGKAIRTVTLNPSVPSDPTWTVVIPRSELGNGDVKVEIDKQGAGSLYYSAELRTLDAAKDLQPESTDPGLKVVRKYYKLEARALENGTLKLLPSKDPITSFNSGDLVRVELTITADKPYEYVLIEEPTPSSCRIQEREELGAGEEWGWWWSRTVVLDDHLAYFARYLDKGTQKITYTLRAEQAGSTRALPTTVENMYDPSMSSSTGDQLIEVTK